MNAVSIVNNVHVRNHRFLISLREFSCSTGSDTSPTAAAVVVLALAGLFLAFGAVWGTGVFGSMVSSGFDTPGSESARAQARTEATVGRGAADVVVLYRDGGRPVGDPAFQAAVEDHLADLPDRPGGVHDDVLDGGSGRRRGSCPTTAARRTPSCSSSARTTTP